MSTICSPCWNIMRLAISTYFVCCNDWFYTAMCVIFALFDQNTTIIWFPDHFTQKHSILDWLIKGTYYQAQVIYELTPTLHLFCIRCFWSICINSLFSIFFYIAFPSDSSNPLHNTSTLKTKSSVSLCDYIGHDYDELQKMVVAVLIIIQKLTNI